MKKLCFLLALLLVFALCGCDSNLDPDDDDDDDDDRSPTVVLTAEETLQEALNALTGRESEGHAVLLGADGYPAIPQNTGIAQLLSACVTFQIKDISSKSSSATAQVKITAPDAPQLLRQAIEGMDTVEEEALYAKIETLLAQEYPTVEHTVEISLVKADESWCVVPSFELSNALTGGLTQAYMDAQQNLLSQLMEGGEAE